MDATSAGMIGKYQVIRVLGRGGMGEVLLAQDDLNRRIAIKRPFKSALEDGLARFKVEARAATLNHPNIPVVYEMGTQDGLPFIAMEFVEGDPLDKLIAAGKPTDLITKLSIIEQVCSGLGYAHQQGIIHRDVKPANVILQPNGVAKILDWGIAKLQNVEMTSALTQTSQIIGSLHYIAPERFKGETIDGRVDIFSAGVMLYLLLTGHLPFEGGEATASYRIVNEKHGSLSTHIRDYPAALDAILDQALAKNQEDRYSTAEDFADALHEVIDELKKSRIDQLIDDAERLNMEGRYAPALELLDEAKKLDPANTQVRKLHRLVREHQDRKKRAERLNEALARANEALASENYTDALALLREAQRIDSTLPELREKIQLTEERKRRYERSLAALAEAEAARNRGDITAALRIVERVLPEDPENSKLLASRGALAKQLETEALHGKVLSILESAHLELAAQHFPAVEQLIAQAEAIDPSHPKIDELRSDLNRTREQEERRRLLDEIHRRVNEFIKVDNYEQAADLLNRAIDKLPTEPTLHRLKLDVDTGARRYTSKLFIDGAITAARDLFTRDPLEALAALQKAIDQMPGEERLIAYERTLRQQFDTLRVEHLLGDTMRKARELLAERNFDKAIAVLESYQLEFGSQADIDDLLTLARNELAVRHRRTIVERATAEVRSLQQSERLDDAIRLLENVLRDAPDATLSRLLQDVRDQQTAVARKLEVVQKRVSLLRERGDLDEAVQVLQDYLAATPNSPSVQNLLNALQAEREQKQVTQEAIASAHQAAQRRDFVGGLDVLETVQRAYGDSIEVTREIQQIQAQRTALAQEVVDQSVEGARAALLRKDPEGALAALKESAPMLEFADQKRQADWQRIAKSAKDELRRTPTAVNTDAIDQLNAIAGIARPAQARKSPVPMFVGIGVAVLAIGGGVWWKLQPPPPPPPQLEAHIRITKAPPGAILKVGDLAPVPVDASGSASLKVKPGTYHVVVSRANFADFDEDVDLSAGETRTEPVELTALSNSGFLAVSAVGGDAAKIKVYVGDVYKGTVNSGGQLPLGVGTYQVHYSAVGYEDSSNKPIKISLKATTNDQYTLLKLKPPLPTVGNLIVTTNPSAQIVLDGGKQRTVADATSGKYTFENLPPGPHTVDVSLERYQSVTAKPVSVEAGKYAQLDARMEPVPPSLEYFNADPTTVEAGKPVKLSWKVDNVSSVLIDPLGSEPASSFTTVYPEQDAPSYKLSANGKVLKQVDITVTPKPTPKAEPTVVVTPPPPPGPQDPKPAIQAALQSFYAAYNGHDAGKMRAIWTGMNPQQLKKLEGLFKEQPHLKIIDSCPADGLTVSGDTANWVCSETMSYVSEGKPNSSTGRITFRLTRAGAAWTIADRR